MKEVENKELKNLNGGISVWAVVGIGSLITFVSGIIDGLIRLKWQNLKSIVFPRNLKEKPLIQIRQKGSIMFTKLLGLVLT